MSHHDVVVVGAGVAGLTAAVRLAESGARVLVLAKGVGATHLAGATIDVLGYAPDRVERPLEALGGLPAGHPYGHVGADGIRAAVDWFKARIAGGSLPGYAYVGTAEENLLLLCHACHRLIDNEDHAPYFTTERLRALKKKHEDRVRVAATSGGMRRTATHVGEWTRCSAPRLFANTNTSADGSRARSSSTRCC